MNVNIEFNWFLILGFLSIVWLISQKKGKEKRERMESLPDCIVQYILSHLNNAKDVVCCSSVSKQWKDSTPFIRSLYFARNIFDNAIKDHLANPDELIYNILSTVVQLEELVVYCPFSRVGLKSWISVSNKSLKHLELRMDNLS